MNTLHALGAILLLSITAFSAQRHHIHLQDAQMRVEIEMRATGLATRILDQLELLPFDANEEAGELSLLTFPQAFGGAATLNSATSLEQVHGLTFVTTVPSDGQPLAFDVALAVQYLDSYAGELVPSIVPTTQKEVSLLLTGPLGTSVLVSRVYTWEN